MIFAFDKKVYLRNYTLKSLLWYVVINVLLLVFTFLINGYLAVKNIVFLFAFTAAFYVACYAGGVNRWKAIQFETSGSHIIYSQVLIDFEDTICEYKKIVTHIDKLNRVIVSPFSIVLFGNIEQSFTKHFTAWAKDHYGQCSDIPYKKKTKSRIKIPRYFDREEEMLSILQTMIYR